MKVHIDQSSTWARRTVRIYVTDSAGPGQYRLYQSKGADLWSFELLNEADVVPDNLGPTLELPLDMLEAIVAASQDFLPPSAATDRHLKDALAQRDRMTGMVERIIDSDLAREAARK